MPDRLEAEVAALIDARLAALCGAPEEGPGLDAQAMQCAAHAVECAWDVVIPHRTLDAIADQTQLIDACARAIRRRRRLRSRRRVLRLPTASRVVLTPPAGQGGCVTQSGILTEYAAEELAQTARRHGAGTRLEILVPMRSSDATLSELIERFAWLGDDDVCVSVRRAQGAS